MMQIKCPQCGAKFKTYPYRLKAGIVCCSKECGNTFKRQEPEMRFWNKVNKTAGCWLWTGVINKQHGYGTFTDETGWPCRAHRYSWMLRYGEIPAETLVCHTCDVRHCVRWDHLFLGTCKDNLQDASSKRRMAWGVRHAMHVLSEAQVHEIRRMRVSGALLREVAKQFGVSVATVSNIARGNNWKNLYGPQPEGAQD